MEPLNQSAAAGGNCFGSLPHRFFTEWKYPLYPADAALALLYKNSVIFGKILTENPCPIFFAVETDAGKRQKMDEISNTENINKNAHKFDNNGLLKLYKI